MVDHNPQDSADRPTTGLPTRQAVLHAVGGGVPDWLLGSTAVGTTRAAPAGGADRDGGERSADDDPPRPGPDILYDDPATPPQLENTGRWSVAPLLVSGATAHVDGEFLYQDFVCDNHGANMTNVLKAPPQPQTDVYTYSPPTGDVVYPTDPDTYGYNAADLLEFRVRKTSQGLAYRITLPTMKAPSVTGVAIGINADGDPTTERDDWGYGIDLLGPLGLDHRIVT